MELNAKHLSILFLLFIVLSAYSKEFLLFLKIFVKLLAEGTSLGKMIFFLLWFFFVFSFLYLKSKGFIQLHFNNEKKFFNNFVFLLILCYFFGFFIYIFTFYYHFKEIPLLFDCIGAFVKENDLFLWEASFFGHIHSNKILLTFLTFSNHLSAFDNGLPLFKITPFANLFSLLLFFLIVILIAYAILEFCNIYSDRITPKVLFWSFTSFCSIVSAIDGGLFSYVGQNSMILLFFYFLIYKENKLFEAAKREIYFFYISFLLLIAAFTILFLTPYYHISLVLSLISFLIFLELSSFLLKNKFSLICYILFLLLFILCLSSIFISADLQNSVIKGQRYTLFIAGLPSNLNKEVLDSLSYYFYDLNIVYYVGHVCFVSGYAKGNYSLDRISLELKNKLSLGSYLVIKKLGNSKKDYVVLTKENPKFLLECQSNFFIVKEIRDNYVYAYSDLFNCDVLTYVFNCYSINNNKTQTSALLDRSFLLGN